MATIQYFKWDGTIHWRHDFEPLGEDEYGRWFGGRAGDRVQRGDEPPIEMWCDVVQLIPDGEMWTAMFQPESDKYALYVDIITVPNWVDDQRVEMIDLDLDVVRRLNGEMGILDEDEFAEHTVRFDYPDDVVTRTRETTDRIAAMVRDRIEPFDRASEPWLARLG